jgi:hypothetical protein
MAGVRGGLTRRAHGKNYSELLTAGVAGHLGEHRGYGPKVATPLSSIPVWPSLFAQLVGESTHINKRKRHVMVRKMARDGYVIKLASAPEDRQLLGIHAKLASRVRLLGAIEIVGAGRIARGPSGRLSRSRRDRGQPRYDLRSL